MDTQRVNGETMSSGGHAVQNSTIGAGRRER